MLILLLDGVCKHNTLTISYLNILYIIVTLLPYMDHVNKRPFAYLDRLDEVRDFRIAYYDVIPRTTQYYELCNNIDDATPCMTQHYI